MMWLIPAAIVIAFSVKGLSLYFSRIALIKVSQEIIRKLSDSNDFSCSRI